MKILLLSILSFMLIVPCSAQYNLDQNNINARAEYDGILFNVDHNTEAGFEIPIGDENSTIFNFNFWVGGKNSGEVYVYGVKYMQFFPDTAHDRYGPIMNSTFYGTEDDLWKRVWKLSKEEIQSHIVNYNSAGYNMPEAIESWPAHGDPSKGQAADLAAFEDVNANGFYEPELGDYPTILGDHAIFLICNSDRDNEGLGPMGIESHVLVYTYDCAEDAYENTVFTYVKHFNRSGLDYEDTYLGYFFDPDIGASFDDNVKVDVDRASVYAFNGDSLDEISNSGPGYQTIIPAQSATILRGVKQDDDEDDNDFGISDGESVNGFGYGDGIVDNEYRGLDFAVSHHANSTSTGEPHSEIERYNILKGKWKDGDTLFYGLWGRNSPGFGLDVISKYNFSENDSEFFGTYGVDPIGFDWEYYPHDPRTIASSGTFTFEDGSVRDMYMAFTTGIGDSISASIAQMKEFIDVIRSDFQQGNNLCGELTLSQDNYALSKNTLSIYPNPTIDQVFIQSNLILEEVKLYNLQGQLELQTKEKQINVSNLIPGIYLVEVKIANEIYREKLVIQ